MAAALTQRGSHASWAASQDPKHGSQHEGGLRPAKAIGVQESFAATFDVLTRVALETE